MPVWSPLRTRRSLHNLVTSCFPERGEGPDPLSLQGERARVRVLRGWGGWVMQGSLQGERVRVRVLRRWCVGCTKASEQKNSAE